MKTLKYLYIILFYLGVSSLASCDHPYFGVLFPLDGDGTDTIITQPLDDTCITLVPVSGPDFVGFVANKDVAVVPPIQWWYNAEPIDLPTFLANYGDLHLYISGINKGGTITGNVSAAQFQGRLGC